MALVDDVKNLVLFSFSLSPERKDELIKALPGLTEDKMQALKALFEDEEQKKNEIIKNAVTRNPQLAEKIEKIIRENVGKMYGDIEKSEEKVKEKEMENLLTDLDGTT